MDRLQSILLKLNPEQIKPVLDTEGAVLVIAGAGSGKTTVATIFAKSLNIPYRFLNATIHNKKDIEKSEKKNAYVQFQPDRIVNIRFTHAQLEQLLEKKWFEKILNLIETDETYQKIKFATDFFKF